MKYYLLEGIFVENHPTGEELKKAMANHFAYLKVGLENGSVLLTGPIPGGSGGIVIVKSSDIQKFCDDDPVVKEGIQQYRIIEFSSNDYQECLKQWFE